MVLYMLCLKSQLSKQVTIPSAEDVDLEIIGLQEELKLPPKCSLTWVNFAVRKVSLIKMFIKSQEQLCWYQTVVFRAGIKRVL